MRPLTALNTGFSGKAVELEPRMPLRVNTVAMVLQGCVCVCTVHVWLGPVAHDDKEITALHVQTLSIGAGMHACKACNEGNLPVCNQGWA